MAIDNYNDLINTCDVCADCCDDVFLFYGEISAYSIYCKIRNFPIDVHIHIWSFKKSFCNYKSKAALFRECSSISTLFVIIICEAVPPCYLLLHKW